MKAARHILLYAILIVVALIFLVPSLWTVISSLKTEPEYFAYPIKLFPKRPYWKNYYLALTMAPFLKFARNSFFQLKSFVLKSMPRHWRMMGFSP